MTNSGATEHGKIEWLAPRLVCKKFRDIVHLFRPDLRCLSELWHEWIDKPIKAAPNMRNNLELLMINHRLSTQLPHLYKGAKYLQYHHDIRSNHTGAYRYAIAIPLSDSPPVTTSPSPTSNPTTTPSTTTTTTPTTPTPSQANKKDQIIVISCVIDETFTSNKYRVYEFSYQLFESDQCKESFRIVSTEKISMFHYHTFLDSAKPLLALEEQRQSKQPLQPPQTPSRQEPLSPQQFLVDLLLVQLALIKIPETTPVVVFPEREIIDNDYKNTFPGYSYKYISRTSVDYFSPNAILNWRLGHSLTESYIRALEQFAWMKLINQTTKFELFSLLTESSLISRLNIEVIAAQSFDDKDLTKSQSEFNVDAEYTFRIWFQNRISMLQPSSLYAVGKLRIRPNHCVCCTLACPNDATMLLLDMNDAPLRDHIVLFQHRWWPHLHQHNEPLLNKLCWIHNLPQTADSQRKIIKNILWKVNKRTIAEQLLFVLPTPT